MAKSFYDLELPGQDNITTRQLTWIFYHYAGNGQKISIVTHSQGCMQVRNAMFTASLFGRESEIRSNVAWLACGSPINDKECNPLPKRYQRIRHKDDFVETVIGGGGLHEGKWPNMPQHSIDKYIGLIAENKETLWMGNNGSFDVSENERKAQEAKAAAEESRKQEEAAREKEAEAKRKLAEAEERAKKSRQAAEKAQAEDRKRAEEAAAQSEFERKELERKKSDAEQARIAAEGERQSLEALAQHAELDLQLVQEQVKFTLASTKALKLKALIFEKGDELNNHQYLLDKAELDAYRHRKAEDSLKFEEIAEEIRQHYTSLEQEIEALQQAASDAQKNANSVAAEISMIKEKIEALGDTE